MLTPKLSDVFDALKCEYGYDSLVRVESMLKSPLRHRDRMQHGAKYVIPGLTAKPWRTIADYPEIQTIETILNKLHTEIKKEVTLARVNKTNILSYKHYKVNMSKWKALYLYKDEQPQTENFDIVPTTAKFLQDYLGELLSPFGEMHFSILEPMTKIPLHCDLWNFTINLHFAVDIPPSGCAIRVANETREWEEGRCLLFDYSYEHEAWNNSDTDRICLLMDIWNPELTIAERKALVALVMELRQLIS